MNYSIPKAIAYAKAWYHATKESGQLPYAIILGFSIYTPFEDFILKLTLMPKPVLTLLGLVPELALYILMGKVFYDRIQAGKKIRITPIDPLVIALFISITISIIINKASIPGSIKNIRAVWRYLAVYYTVANIDISMPQLQQLLNVVRISGLIQASVASLQFFLPSKVSQILFAPKGSNAAQGALDHKGANFGTFGDNAILAGFLLVITIVWLVYVLAPSPFVYNAKDAASMLAIYFGIFSSKKRATLVILLFVPIIILIYFKRYRAVLTIIWSGLALGLIASFVLPLLNFETSYVGGKFSDSEESFDITSYFLTIFSAEYWQHTAEASRGWMIITICRSIVMSGSIFGFGPELGSVRKKIQQLLTEPEDQVLLENNLFVYEDPYWFGVLGFIGFPGLLLYWMILLRIFQYANVLIRMTSSQEYKNLGVIVKTLTQVAFFYGFIERIFKLRPFAFYFWLLAGLAVNAYYVERKKRLSGSLKEDK